ncbi:MAG: ribonuclease HII [Peptococcaceae bacterium]|nr:ribonuclease HII [Peptococcaceae bacterium]
MDEIQRINQLMQMENELRFEGYRLVAGVDEAGRGPLAGPVIASACILPDKFDLPGLDDSKRLTEKKRQYLAQKIKEQAVAFSLGSASSREIDLLNILKATKLAMKRALENLQIKPDYILVDGRDRLNIPFLHKTVIGGDGLCACIAAASILAKVSRDELMCEIHEIYPEYCFDQHKGYGTRMHLEAIYKFGPCPIHRQSFSPIKEIILPSFNELG